ncbi:MAG: hypothetical protein ABJQ58_01055, partial [Marinomonas sp.]
MTENLAEQIQQPGPCFQNPEEIDRSRQFVDQAIQSRQRFSWIGCRCDRIDQIGQYCLERFQRSSGPQCRHLAASPAFYRLQECIGVWQVLPGQRRDQLALFIWQT